MLLARKMRSHGLVVSGSVDGSGSFLPSPNGSTSDALEMKVTSVEGGSWLSPCEPRQFIAIWNNSRSAMEKYGLSLPSHPLYFLKPYSSYAAHEDVISIPESSGRIVFEGELGVVISRECSNVSANSAVDFILGYTCVNDVTSLDILQEDSSFPQWTRAKGLRGFTPFGPIIATDLNINNIVVQTIVNGRRMQNYSLSDLIFSPYELVSRISYDLTLYPGDVISCGTSVGVRPIRDGDQIDVLIEGIGILRNRFVSAIGTKDTNRAY